MFSVTFLSFDLLLIWEKVVSLNRSGAPSVGNKSPALLPVRVTCETGSAEPAASAPAYAYTTAVCSCFAVVWQNQHSTLHQCHTASFILGTIRQFFPGRKAHRPWPTPTTESVPPTEVWGICRITATAFQWESTTEAGRPLFQYVWWPLSHYLLREWRRAI